MGSRLFELFDDYAAAYARGERPDAEAYLAQAGAEREELASLLAEYLRRAPAPAPSEDDQRYLGLMLAEEPPLLVLRVERGLRVDDVVDELAGKLGVESTKRPKLKRYYQELEGGLLDPRRLSRRLRGVLAEIYGPTVESAFTWRAPTAVPAGPFLRKADYLESAAADVIAKPEAEDEVDRLFLGG